MADVKVVFRSVAGYPADNPEMLSFSSSVAAKRYVEMAIKWESISRTYLDGMCYWGDFSERSGIVEPSMGLGMAESGNMIDLDALYDED